MSIEREPTFRERLDQIPNAQERELATKFLNTFGNRVIYQEEGITIVNKPRGLISSNEPEYPDPRHPLGIQDVAQEILGPQTKVAHRLDLDTSGLLMLAQTNELYKPARELFGVKAQEQSVKKYLAVLAGEFPYGSVEVAGYLEYTNKGVGRLVHPTEDTTGLEWSRTIIQTLGYTELQGKRVTAVGIHIPTGKRNQIRIIASHLGNPVVADWKYDRGNNWRGKTLLHSYELFFTHPTTKKREVVRAPIPLDMKPVFEPFKHLLLP